MTTRKLIISIAAIQLLASITFLAVNEIVDAGKFVEFRNVSIADREGGDVDTELGKSVRRMSAEYYYPSIIFGSVCIVTSLAVGITAAVRRVK